MKLCKTKMLMDSLLENRDLDSYAILVCSDGEKSLLTSPKETLCSCAYQCLTVSEYEE